MDGLKLRTRLHHQVLAVSNVSPFLWCAFYASLGKQLCFSSVQGRKGNFMTNKVENKRERNVISAAKSGDWTKVDKLLNQPINNLSRKDRQHGLSSLNITISKEGRATELMDLYPDNTYNPIEHLLIKERNEYLYTLLSKLPKDDLHILLEITLHGTSALQLTRETSFKSHKTVKKHYEDTLDFLKDELGKYF